MTGAPANGKPSAAPRDETLDRIADMATDLKDLARVRMELVAEQVRDATVHGRRAMWLALVAAAATATAVVFVVRGLAAGIASRLDPTQAWLADLATGALVLGAVVGAHFVRLAAGRRRRVRRLERTLEPRGGTARAGRT